MENTDITSCGIQEVAPDTHSASVHREISGQTLSGCESSQSVSVQSSDIVEVTGEESMITEVTDTIPVIGQSVDGHWALSQGGPAYCPATQGSMCFGAPLSRGDVVRPTQDHTSIGVPLFGEAAVSEPCQLRGDKSSSSEHTLIGTLLFSQDSPRGLPSQCHSGRRGGAGDFRQRKRTVGVHHPNDKGISHLECGVEGRQFSSNVDGSDLRESSQAYHLYSNPGWLERRGPNQLGYSGTSLANHASQSRSYQFYQSGEPDPSAYRGSFKATSLS